LHLQPPGEKAESYGWISEFFLSSDGISGQQGSASKGFQIAHVGTAGSDLWRVLLTQSDHGIVIKTSVNAV
jgi:hypothetical protein